MAINFSRPGSQVVAQYFNLVRLGFDGYRRIHQASQDVALWLSGQLQETGAFELITRGDDLPVFAFRCSGASSDFNPFDLSERYRDRGWQVPAYPFPDNRSDVVALRIVCREGFNHDLAESFMTDTRRHLDHFAGRRPSAAEATAFHH